MRVMILSWMMFAHCLMWSWSLAVPDGSLSIQGSFSSQDVAPSGSCHSLAGTYEERLLNPCSGVVDYQFFVPNGQSVQSLMTRARNLLNSTVIMTTPSLCAQSIVRLVCAQVYLKCYDNVDFSNTASYNSEIYASISLSYVTPVYRPCLSVCNDVRSRCLGSMYGLSPGLPTCTGVTFDYAFGNVVTGLVTNPARYDASNDASKCFIPNMVPVAGQVEQFKHRNDGSFCSGLASDIFVGAGNSVNASLAVVQQEFTFQSLAYENIVRNTKDLPVFMEQNCMLALRKYICYQAFFTPQIITLRRALEYTGLNAVIASLQSSNPAMLGMTIRVPLFPPEDVCLEYQSTCSRLLSNLDPATQGGLIPNCTGFLPNRPGIRTFPATEQTVTTVSTSLGTIRFPGGPNPALYYNESELPMYETQCPTGFVIPDHPDDPATPWIGGTGCAVSCK